MPQILALNHPNTYVEWIVLCIVSFEHHVLSIFGVFRLSKVALIGFSLAKKRILFYMASEK